MINRKTIFIITCCTGALLAFGTVPVSASTSDDGHALWGNIDYDGAPWVENASSQAAITKGLQGRHIALWASHGRYYDNKRGRWVWQRPNLFCTTEDLFTPTIVVPF